MVVVEMGGGGLHKPRALADECTAAAAAAAAAPPQGAALLTDGAWLRVVIESNDN